MKKIINVKHHMDDYECMWNGIEDLYMQENEEKLPSNLFFALSGFGCFCYMKTEKANIKRMIAFGDGRTQKMYEFLSPIAGFSYKFHVCATFERALLRSKKEIDADYPVILGALDMYYIPYFSKLYHAQHIPFHYIMMIGYDDEKECIYLYDCGREERMEIPYKEMELSWNCSYSGLSRPFTLCTVRIKQKKSVDEIAREALKIRADQFIHPAAGMVGYRGMEKMIKEMPGWKNEMSKEEYDKVFINLVEFMGTVPTVPNALRGIDKPDEVTFYGGFDKMSVVLKQLGARYHEESWLKSAAVFEQGGPIIEEIVHIIVAYLTGKEDKMDEVPKLFNNIKNLMIKAYQMLL